jgi:hypothetical protein
MLPFFAQAMIVDRMSLRETIRAQLVSPQLRYYVNETGGPWIRRKPYHLAVGLDAGKVCLELFDDVPNNESIMFRDWKLFKYHYEDESCCCKYDTSNCQYSTSYYCYGGVCCCGGESLNPTTWFFKSTIVPTSDDFAFVIANYAKYARRVLIRDSCGPLSRFDKNLLRDINEWRFEAMRTYKCIYNFPEALNHSISPEAVRKFNSGRKIKEWKALMWCSCGFGDYKMEDEAIYNEMAVEQVKALSKIEADFCAYMFLYDVDLWRTDYIEFDILELLGDVVGRAIKVGFEDEDYRGCYHGYFLATIRPAENTTVSFDYFRIYNFDR